MIRMTTVLLFIPRLFSCIFVHLPVCVRGIAERRDFVHRLRCQKLCVFNHLGFLIRSHLGEIFRAGFCETVCGLRFAISVAVLIVAIVLVRTGIVAAGHLLSGAAVADAAGDRSGQRRSALDHQESQQERPAGDRQACADNDQHAGRRRTGCQERRDEDRDACDDTAGRQRDESDDDRTDDHDPCDRQTDQYECDRERDRCGEDAADDRRDDQTDAAFAASCPSIAVAVVVAVAVAFIAVVGRIAVTALLGVVIAAVVTGSVTILAILVTALRSIIGALSVVVVVIRTALCVLPAVLLPEVRAVADVFLPGLPAVSAVRAVAAAKAIPEAASFTARFFTLHVIQLPDRVVRFDLSRDLRRIAQFTDDLLLPFRACFFEILAVVRNSVIDLIARHPVEFHLELFQPVSFIHGSHLR